MALRNNQLWMGVATAATALMLTGCGAISSDSTPRAAAVPAATATVADDPVRVGAPYSIGGRSYTPVDQIDYDDVGYASFYGLELEGSPTANGEAFLPSGVSAAHRTLPMPSYVEVTRLDTGRTIVVRVNDRGPADPNRLIDLSAGAAEQLGITEQGMVQVRVRRTNPLESERIALRSGLAVPPRLDTPDSLLSILRERAARLPVPSGFRRTPARPARPATATANAPGPETASAATSAIPAGNGPLVVQIAAFSNRERAEALARRLNATVSQSGNVFRVRYGPFTNPADAQAAAARARQLGQPGAVILHDQ